MAQVEPLGPVPDRPVTGRWVDDYFLVEQIDPDTFAIGEPRYYQGNYSYLITGTAARCSSMPARARAT